MKAVETSLGIDFHDGLTSQLVSGFRKVAAGNQVAAKTPPRRKG
jgi:hypothetical protein